MQSDRRNASDGTGGEGKSVTEVWTAGRLKQAEKLLERFAKEFTDREAQDPNLLRDYYLWTGKPHYRTDFAWNAGRPEDAGEEPADVIERVNCGGTTAHDLRPPPSRRVTTHRHNG